MPTVSDYVVVLDIPRTLEIGGDIDKDFDFSLPSNLRTGTGRNRAVASWQLEVEEPSSLKYHVLINGTEIGSYMHITPPHAKETFAATQEVFSSSLLNAGVNTAKVEVLSGGGRIRVSSFVIHFQVDV
jgi:hypothetical protein